MFDEELSRNSLKSVWLCFDLNKKSKEYGDKYRINRLNKAMVTLANRSDNRIAGDLAKFTGTRLQYYYGYF